MKLSYAAWVRTALLAATPLTLCLLPLTAFAIPYTFTKITDAPFRAASLNNLGEVAYLAGTSIFLGDGTNVSSLTQLSVDSGYPLRPPLPIPNGAGIAVNDGGTVVYQCAIDQMCRVNRDGSVSGGIPAAHNSPSINNSGEVPYRTPQQISVANPATGNRSIYGVPEALQNGEFYAGGLADAPAINDKGEVLFSAVRNNSLSAYFVSDGVAVRQVGPQFGIPPIPNIGPDSFEVYGLSNLGAVIALLMDEGKFFLSIENADGTSNPVVGWPHFASIAPMGINDFNEVAFYGRESPSNSTGIYRGNANGFGKVIGEGDSLFGSPIISISLITRDALNNGNQILFAATTENGTGLYRADPFSPTEIPEPTSLALMALSLLGVIRYRRPSAKSRPEHLRPRSLRNKATMGSPAIAGIVDSGRFH